MLTGTIWNISIIIAGLIFGILVDIRLLNPQNFTFKNIFKFNPILSGLCGVLLFFLITSLYNSVYLTNRNNIEITKNINNDLLKQATSYIYKKNDGIEKEIYEIGLDRIIEHLNEINNNEIYIERKDIDKIWKMLFNNTENGSEIWATNCVIPSEWRNFNIAKQLGIDIQQEAIERQVKIKRVHFLDYEDTIFNHAEGQNYIDSILTSELDSNYYESKKMSLKRFSSWINNNYDIRFRDIGICNIGTNKEILFITDLSDDFSINGTWITTKKSKLEEAKTFYLELWKELK